MSTVSKHIIFVMGNAGAGKSTLINEWCRNNDAVHLQLGPILTAEHPEKIAESRGLSLDYKLVVNTLIRELNTYNRNYIIIDGFPKNRQSYDYFTEMYKERDDGYPIFWNIYCNEEDAQKRVELRGRLNDSPKRYEEYCNDTLPLVDSLSESFPLQMLNIDTSVNDVDTCYGFLSTFMDELQSY